MPAVTLEARPRPVRSVTTAPRGYAGEGCPVRRANPSYAQTQCALHLRAYQDARAAGAAEHYLSYIRSQISVWCALP